MALKTLSRLGIFILSFILTMNLNVSGQGSVNMVDIPKVVPPSPNAAALGKFGDIPLGAYTGLPNVSIPLHTMTLGKFSLPISLNYHSGGLKVEEVSSSVGLGWSLSAGGVITRSMHGRPDESSSSYWAQSSLTNEYIASGLLPTIGVCGGTFDKQPDIFYFNFAGQSGKFLLDSTPTHDARFIPYANFKLTHDAELNSFSITDADGIVYNFSSKETTLVGEGNSAISYTSAWYLTKIITPSGDINFTYAMEITTQAQVSEVDYLPTYPSVPCGDFVPDGGTLIEEIDVDALLLTSISSPRETITTLTSPNRKDMATASMINGLTIKDMGGNIVKKFSFAQSYFGNINSIQANDVRLKLDRVDEISISDNTQRKSYTLQYYSPELVPSVASYAKDFWGFYNGHDGNHTCLPYIDPTLFGAYIAGHAGLYGNRDPDAEKSKIGVLKSIQYPTGGATNFIYEGNDYSFSDGVAHTHAPLVQKQALANAKIAGTINIPVYTSNFSIESAQAVSLVATGSYSGPAPAENGPSLMLNKINTDGSRTNFVQLYMVNNTQTLYPALEVGNYELIASVDGNGQNILGTVAYYAVDTVASHLTRIFPTGGVRLRQIVNTDPFTGKTTTKVFRYRSSSDTTISSGVLTSDFLVGEYKKSYAFGCEYLVRSSSSSNYLGSTQGSHVGYGVVTEKDSGSTSLGKKESYFYTSVNSPNQFSNQYHIPYPGILNQLGPNKKYQTDYDVYRGFLKKELTYNSSNNVIHSLVNSYNFDEPMSFNSPNYYSAQATAGYFTILCAHGCKQCEPINNGTDYPNCTNYDLQNFIIVNYQVICPWIYKTSTITATYDQNGQTPLIDTTRYYYDNPSHGQITRVVSTNSKGDSLLTVNMYPGDKTQIQNLDPVSSTTLDSMVSRNMVAPLIQEEHYNNNHFLSRQRTDYKIWPGLRNNIAPSKVWSQTLNNPLENRINFVAYDYNNNPVQVSKQNDVNEVYLWGYRGQYPVAKVTGSDSATVSSFISPLVVEYAGAGITEQQIRFELSKIRTGLANTKALVTTYTYAPLIGMISETDPGGKITSYEYDGFGRLKNIKDYLRQIVKNFQYNYANSCGNNCVVLAMQTFTGYNTPGYPVGVFNGSKQYIGIAHTPAEYVTLWNSNAANQAIGVLSANADPLHFNLSVATNAVAPPVVYGLRFYQWIGVSQTSINIASDTLSFVDWGDGNQQLLTQSRVFFADNSWYNYAPVRNEIICFGIPVNHSYSNGQLNTVTVFHNETAEIVNFNVGGGKDDLLHESNIVGNYPEKVKAIAYNYMSNCSDTGVINFSQLTEVVQAHYQLGITTSTRHYNWQSINNFHKLKWMKMLTANGNEIVGNLRANFPNITYMEFQGFKPDVTQTWGTGDGGFPFLYIYANGLTSGNYSTAEIDLIINSQAAASGFNITNGLLGFAPVPVRSAASDAAYNALLARGWNLQITNP